jgi:hypothetical protein
MTGPHDYLARPSVEAATSDLEQLKQLLLRASLGEVAADDLRDSLRSYWRTHRTVLSAAAASLGEQIRLQVLQKLYEWRAQLAQSPAVKGTSESSRHDDPAGGGIRPDPDADR